MKKVSAEKNGAIPNEDAYRVIVDTMTEGAVILARSGNILYSNECFASLMHCKPDDLTGRSFSAYVAPSDQSHFSNLLDYARKRPGRAEVNLLKSENEVILAGLSAAPLEAGALNGIYLIVSDISLRRRAEENLIQAHSELQALVREKHSEAVRATAELRNEAYERRLAEARLAEKEDRFRLLLENAWDIVMVLHNRTVTYASPPTRKILEYNPEDISGKQFLELVHIDDQQETRHNLDRGELVPGCSFSFDVRMRTKSGASRRIEVLGRNLLHDERIKGIVLNGRDISDRS